MHHSFPHPCPLSSLPRQNDGDASPEALTRALKYTYISAGVLTLVLVVAWPLLALPAGVFSQVSATPAPARLPGARPLAPLLTATSTYAHLPNTPGALPP
jgi:hypothetical protein